MIDVLLAVLAGCVGAALAIGAYLWTTSRRPQPYTPPPLPQMRSEPHEIDEVTHGMDDWNGRVSDAISDDRKSEGGAVTHDAVRDHLRRHMGDSR